MYMAIAVALIFIVFFLIFRRQIVDLLNRIKTISKDGVVLDSKRQKSKVEVDPQKEAESLMRQFDNVLIREVEDSVKSEFSKKNLLGAEGVPVLIKFVSALSIAYTFSEVYRVIWGSQLSLLDYLNTKGSQPVADLRVFYNSGASQYPLVYAEYSFEQWLAFLKGQLLIREDNALIGITVRGREFLTYLTTTGLTRNKAG